MEYMSCRGPSVLTSSSAIAFCLLAFLGSVGVLRAQVQTARIVTGDWPPYVGHDLPDNGVCARIVSAAMREMGLQPEYVFLPWKRALDEAERSDTNSGYYATFPHFDTPERKTLFYLSDPIFVAETVIYFNVARHPELAGIKNVEELRGLTAVSTEGYAHPGSLNGIMVKVEEERNDHDAFQRLIKDPDVHYMAASRRVGERILARDFVSEGFDIQVIPAFSWRDELHLMASKRNPNSWQFVQDFNAALASVRRSGVLDELQDEDGGAAGTFGVVTLEALAGEWIVGRDPDNPDRHFALVSGTRAVIINWGAAYTEPRTAAIDSDARTCRVRILTGPALGQTVDVDGRHINLEQE